MAAALPLPLAGQWRAFLSIPISDPGRARAVIVGYPSDSFSPKPPESTKQKKEKNPKPNQIRLFEPPRAPPRPTQTPPCPLPHPHPPPGRSGTRFWEPRGPLRRGRCGPSSCCSCPADQDRPAGARLLVHLLGVQPARMSAPEIPFMTASKGSDEATSMRDTSVDDTHCASPATGPQGCSELLAATNAHSRP